ncbi:MAG TPA: hypothetical protein VLX68_17715 [Chitinivibrionales bacterium]|nr:hypothetical protein [Chitinivibrionales bacterium]
MQETKPSGLQISSSTWVRIIIIFQLVLLGTQFTPGLSTNGDDARYYLLGKAIHDGKGFRQIQHPTMPVEKTYPAVFPLMLSFLDVFSDSILLAKIAQGILGACVTLLAFMLFRIYSKNLLVPMVLLCAGSATLAQFSLSLMSEIPYLFFSLLALYLYELSVANPKKAWLFWLTAVISVFPMHCRSVGLAFSASWILTTLFTKRYSYAAAHVVLLLATVVVFHMLTSWENSYLVQIIQKNTYDPEAGFVTPAEMAQRVMENIKAYGSIIMQRSLLPLPFPSTPGQQTAAGIFIVVFILLGWARGLFGAMKFLSLYVFMYFGILLMWQTQWSSERFVAGVVPFLFFFLLYGLEGAVGVFAGQQKKTPFLARLKNAALDVQGPPVPGRAAAWIAVAFVLVLNVSYASMFLRKSQALGPDWKNFYSCADWMRINTPPDAVVMNRKVELFYIRAKRAGVMYSYSHDVNNIMREIDSAHVDYVVLDNFAWTATTRQYLYPVLQTFPDRFQMVYVLNNPPTAVYKVIRQ